MGQSCVPALGKPKRSILLCSGLPLLHVARVSMSSQRSATDGVESRTWRTRHVSAGCVPSANMCDSARLRGLSDS
jgi:hypothetical protein